MTELTPAGFALFSASQTLPQMPFLLVRDVPYQGEMFIALRRQSNHAILVVCRGSSALRATASVYPLADQSVRRFHPKQTESFYAIKPTLLSLLLLHAEFQSSIKTHFSRGFR